MISHRASLSTMLRMVPLPQVGEDVRRETPDTNTPGTKPDICGTPARKMGPPPSRPPALRDGVILSA